MNPKYIVDGEGRRCYVKAKMRPSKYKHFVAVNVGPRTDRIPFASLDHALKYYLQMDDVGRMKATVQRITDYEVEVTECGKE